MKGESLDLIKYINKNFEGPELLPDVSNFLVFVLIGTLLHSISLFTSRNENYRILQSSSLQKSCCHTVIPSIWLCLKQQPLRGMSVVNLVSKELSRVFRISLQMIWSA